MTGLGKIPDESGSSESGDPKWGRWLKGAGPLLQNWSRNAQFLLGTSVSSWSGKLVQRPKKRNSFHSRVGFPNLWDLMPGDLRWS